MKLLGGMVAVVVLSAGTVLFAGAAGAGSPPGASPGPDAASSSASSSDVAQLSLGNRAAVPTLQTRAPRPPSEAPAGKIAYTETLRAAPGDTLSGMLTGTGIERAEALSAIAALGKHYDARRIMPGQEVTVTFAPGPDGAAPGRFLGFTLIPQFDRRITVTRTEDGRFTATEAARPLTRRLIRVSGTIKENLFDAGTAAGLPVSVLIEMIRAYSWDVDFQRDVRPGDSFEIMFERFFDGRGKVVHDGRIFFVALALSGTRHTLYRYTDADGRAGYFDEKGHSARKALLRTPVDGARLSSSYGRRRHPVLGYTRMHRGIDFAAPRGTPIYAAGKGTVEVAGRNGAYGRYIRIRHNSRYATAYAHMSRFAKGMRRGKRVKQGQVIGYVGSTGRTTGPHLHYEILVGGRQVNPLTVKMPAGRRLKGRALARLRNAIARIDSQLADLATDLEVAGDGE